VLRDCARSSFAVTALVVSLSALVLTATQTPVQKLQALLAATPIDEPKVIEAIDLALAGVPADSSQFFVLSETLMPVVRARVALAKAASVLEPAVASWTREKAAASFSRRTRKPSPTAREIDQEFAAELHRPLELLAMAHLGLGKVDLAKAEFERILEADAARSYTRIGLGQIEARAGRAREALEHYLVAAARLYPLPADDNAAMTTLYARVHGRAATSAELDAEIDRVYRKYIGHPIPRDPYVPPANRSDRMVVVELFTGTGCLPCTAADLAFDAVLDRYPAGAIAPLQFHLNVLPDPMAIASGITHFHAYEKAGLPEFFLDGAYTRQGGGQWLAAREVYDDYVAAIDKALTVRADATVSIEARWAGDVIRVSVKLDRLPADGKPRRLKIALTEKELSFPGEYGVRLYSEVVRAFDEIPLTGASASIEHSFDPRKIAADVTATLAADVAKRRVNENPARPAVYRAEGRALTALKRDALAVVAYVQDSGLHILQGARAPVGTAGPATIAAALDQYQAGDHAAAISSVNKVKLTVGALTTEATAWVKAVPAESPRRSMIAAAFALDLAWTATRVVNRDSPATIDPSGARGDFSDISISQQSTPLPIVTWASTLMPVSGPVSVAERAWWLASVEMLEDVAASRAIEAHLVRARRRIPDEPRWRLAEAIARARPKLGNWRRRDDPWLIGTQHLRAERTPAGADITAAAREFALLAGDTSQPALAAEAETYLGWLELKRKKWADAIPHFTRARQLATEPFILATADYLAGFVHEQMEQPNEAIAAYRRAHAIAPDVRNVATRLAALLYLANQREEAYRIVEASEKRDSGAEDLLALFLRADARFLAGHIGTMRAALR
jgi:tetratricopeptide (TPR) repeat protein